MNTRPLARGCSPLLMSLSTLAGAALAWLTFSAQTPAPSSAAAAPITPRERITLFNGKDITGWQPFVGTTGPIPTTTPASQPSAKVWSVTDGVLKLDTKSAGYLVTDKSYSNYKLHVEWRWPKDANPRSNSGILLHVHGSPSIWPLCYEAQLQNGNAGQVTGMALDIPDAPMINNRKRANRGGGVTEKTLGEWNAYDIVVQDDTIDLTVNGNHANKVTRLPIKSGAIALQMEGYPIEFQNIWIEPIP